MPTLDPDFAALLGSPAQNGSATAAPSTATNISGLDPDFAQLLSQPVADKTNAPQQSPSALGPWASAIVRPVAKAVAGLPLMAGDAGIALGNMVRPPIDRALGIKQSPDLPLTMPAFNRLLDKYTTAPQGVGKAAEFVSTGLVGSQLPMPGISNPAPASFVKPSTSALTEAQQTALQQGQDLGMRATPGAQQGSKVLQQVEAKLESQPWTSGPFNALKAGNQAALDRTAARAIGEEAPTVDATVLGKASERLGKVFESVRTPDNKVIVDPKATDAVLRQIDSDYEGLLPNDGSILDNKLVGRLSSLTSEGTINGQQLGALSSKLGKAAYKQMTGQSGDRDLGKALYAVKDHVDDLLESTLSGEDASAYSAARSQYRTLMQLTSRIGTVNPSTGHVSGASLANYLQQTDRPGFLYGKNQTDLYKAARFAQAFKPVVGDSGTATRSAGLGDMAALLGAAHVAGPGALAMPLGANLASRMYLSRLGQATTGGLMGLPNILPSLRGPAMGGLLAAQTLNTGQ
jgi:hypothetical protein